MAVASINERLIFGLKLKFFRQASGFLLQDLSEATGISVSYLNEIEKAKKYPRPDKINAIAKALKVTASELSSKKLPVHLTPIAELLDSQFLQELPLELFGIDIVKVTDIIAESPGKVGAFITAILELAKQYGQESEHFYLSALRSYQELHNNYFSELEASATNILLSLNADTSVNSLQLFLGQHGISCIETDFSAFPKLKYFKSIYSENSKTLSIHKDLNEREKRYILAREVGFQFLGLNPRPATNIPLKVLSFDILLNHFSASYCAMALLVPETEFKKDLKSLLELPTWQPSILIQWIDKYDVAPFILIHRFSLLPRILGIDNIFFLRSKLNLQSQQVEIDRELHLSRRHDPHANRRREHYCRRWLAIRVFDAFHENDESIIIKIQRSIYHYSGNEYLCIAIAEKKNDKEWISHTAGMLLDMKSDTQIKFCQDPEIERKIVNVTCERCDIKDCIERVTEPIILNAKDNFKQIQRQLDKFLNT